MELNVFLKQNNIITVIIIMSCEQICKRVFIRCHVSQIV